jgi:hypothetical protein
MIVTEDGTRWRNWNDTNDSLVGKYKVFRNDCRIVVGFNNLSVLNCDAY